MDGGKGTLLFHKSPADQGEAASLRGHGRGGDQLVGPQRGDRHSAQMSQMHHAMISSTSSFLQRSLSAASGGCGETYQRQAGGAVANGPVREEGGNVGGRRNGVKH
jgi:hypothetical protein